MNDQNQIFRDLKDLILENWPNLRDNARRQLNETGQTDDETTLHLVTHATLFSGERLGKLTKWLIGLTIALAFIASVNIILLVKML